MIGTRARHAADGRDTQPRITVYSRPGCHLCDDMKTVVARVATRAGLTVEEVDISTDVELEARYGLEIPVLVLDGRKVAKYRITEEALHTILSRRRARLANE